MRLHGKNQVEQMILTYELFDYENISFVEIYLIKLSTDLRLKG